MKLHNKLVVIGIISVSVATSGAVQADELVSNGDFSQTLTGWTLTGDTSLSFVNANNDISGNPSLPGYSFIASTDTTQGALSQSLNLISGFSYNFKFDLNDASDSFFSNSSRDFFQASLGTQTLLDLTTSVDNTLLSQTNYNFLYTAITDSTPLTFSFMNQNSQFYLSNISITTVPVPQVWPLMLTGLLLVGKRLRPKQLIA